MQRPGKTFLSELSTHCAVHTQLRHLRIVKVNEVMLNVITCYMCKSYVCNIYWKNLKLFFYQQTSQYNSSIKSAATHDRCFRVENVIHKKRNSSTHTQEIKTRQRLT